MSRTNKFASLCAALLCSLSPLTATAEPVDTTQTATGSTDTGSTDPLGPMDMRIRYAAPIADAEDAEDTNNTDTDNADTESTDTTETDSADTVQHRPRESRATAQTPKMRALSEKAQAHTDENNAGSKNATAKKGDREAKHTITQGDMLMIEGEPAGCRVGYIDHDNRVIYTARHCGNESKGATVSSRGRVIGTILFDTLKPYSKTFHRGDVQAIKVFDNVSLGKNIYSGDTLYPFEKLQKGDTVCGHAAMQRKGPQCSYVVAVNDGDVMIDNTGMIKGDSGGAFWKINEKGESLGLVGVLSHDTTYYNSSRVTSTASSITRKPCKANTMPFRINNPDVHKPYHDCGIAPYHPTQLRALADHAPRTHTSSIGNVPGLVVTAVDNGQIVPVVLGTLAAIGGVIAALYQAWVAVTPHAMDAVRGLR